MDAVAMFNTQLTRSGRTRAFSVSPATGDGWEVVEEADDRIVRRTQYRDWHRVERALAELAETVSRLETEGWEPVAR